MKRLLDRKPKRVNFIQIQQAHTVAAEGYHQPYLRTGYEYVISNRTSDMFAYNAKQDGKVISVNDKGIIIEYQDGTRKGVSLGRSFGKAEGSIYPHDIITTLKPGDTFVKGDNIAYNKGFFEQDFLDPKRVVMKNSMVVKTALLESNQTHEDSSSISQRVTKMMTAKTTKVKSITVGFNQNIHDIVQVGKTVKVNDPLMIIEDQMTSSNSTFDENSLALLKELSSQSPRSKYNGVIDKIEVFYNGDKLDMSASLKKLTDASDRLLAEQCKSTGKPVITGRVSSEYRVSGTPLILDKAEIKIYITIETPAGVGDKGVFASQMKSVVGEVRDYEVVTESGENVDAIFGYRSISARIVTSPELMGTTITLLKVIGKKAVSIYRGK